MRILLLPLLTLVGCLPTDPSADRDPYVWDDPRDDAPSDPPPAIDVGPTRSANDRDFLPAALLAIDAATDQVRVAQYVMYRDTLVDPLYDALTSAASRGVQVQVLADETGSDTEDVLRALERRGVEGKLDSPRITLHAKLIIADDTVVMGSHNFTGPALVDNAEASLLVADADAAAALATWFDALWAEPDSAPTLPASDAALVPIADPDLTDALTACIDTAQSAVDVQMYAIAWDARYPGSDVDEVLSALAAAAARGVDVRVTVDRSDWMVDNDINTAAIERLLADGIDVWTTDPDITSHAKVIRCDDTVIVSDANWSYSGLERMRGVSVRVTDSALSASYAEWMASKRHDAVD